VLLGGASAMVDLPGLSDKCSRTEDVPNPTWSGSGNPLQAEAVETAFTRVTMDSRGRNSSGGFLIIERMRLVCCRSPKRPSPSCDAHSIVPWTKTELHEVSNRLRI
jgi:hypothetical protein